MFGAAQVRDLIGAADPVRNAPRARPPQPADAVIAIATATATAATATTTPTPTRDGGATAVPQAHRARPTRRLALVAAAAVAVAATGVTVAVDPFGGSGGSGGQPDGRSSTVDSRANGGEVVVPVAYQITTDAPPAAGQLRALAARIGDAPYDTRTGRYAYHKVKSWGDPQMSDGNGHEMSFVMERETWLLPDGSGRQQVGPMTPQYPDQASKDYWTAHPMQTAKPSASPGPTTSIDPDTSVPGNPDNTPSPTSMPSAGTGPTTSIDPDTSAPGRSDRAPLPTGTAALADFLKVRVDNGGGIAKRVLTTYTRYVVPRQTRADILTVLAGVPGFTWRGTVTDRAGRAGVAITFDDRGHGVQELLIVDPQTGGLLAMEIVWDDRPQVNAYFVVLATDRTDTAG